MFKFIRKKKKYNQQKGIKVISLSNIIYYDEFDLPLRLVIGQKENNIPEQLWIRIKKEDIKSSDKLIKFKDLDKPFYFL